MSRNIECSHVPEFQFRYWGGKLGRCELHLYRKAGGDTVCVVTDRCERFGCASVTNAAEYICAAAVIKYNLDGKKTRFIEHYPDGRYDLSEIIPNGVAAGNNVEPRYTGVSWNPITRAAVEELIGQKLEDSP